VGAGLLSTARRARRLREDEQVGEGLLEGDTVSGAEFFLQGVERYGRIQVEDSFGRFAWTNPLFIDPWSA
jgi:hypothetical protein